MPVLCRVSTLFQKTQGRQSKYTSQQFKGTPRTAIKGGRLVKPTSGFHSCLRTDPQRAQVSLWRGLRTGTHHHTAGRHFPDQQMGTAGSATGQQEALTDRLPVQNFIGGMMKVDYQKCNLLVLQRACFSLKVPTQQLFITSFLLLEKLLGWHGNIFPP